MRRRWLALNLVIAAAFVGVWLMGWWFWWGFLAFAIWNATRIFLIERRLLRRRP